MWICSKLWALFATEFVYATGVAASCRADRGDYVGICPTRSDRIVIGRGGETGDATQHVPAAASGRGERVRICLATVSVSSVGDWVVRISIEENTFHIPVGRRASSPAPRRAEPEARATLYRTPGYAHASHLHGSRTA